MPSYDYLCPANKRIVEVAHSMRTRVSTWGELCQLAGLELGDTAASEPVQRCIGSGIQIRSRATHAPTTPGGATSGSCCGVPGCAS